jgi:hypothetical protein
MCMEFVNLLLVVWRLCYAVTLEPWHKETLECLAQNNRNHSISSSIARWCLRGVSAPLSPLRTVASISSQKTAVKICLTLLTFL